MVQSNLKYGRISASFKRKPKSILEIWLWFYHKIWFQPKYSAKLQNVLEHNFSMQLFNLEAIPALAPKCAGKEQMKADNSADFLSMAEILLHFS